jgi:disintegrin and metalloproteinase domain-containing protein 10
MDSQVNYLNSIFQKYQLFDSGFSTNRVTFQVYRTKIYKTSDCTSSLGLCESNLDAVTYLNTAAQTDATISENFCLSYIFTARDFADGTLGLAWVADTSKLGGICEKTSTIDSNIRALNTGMVTLVSYNTRVPELTSQLTFVHEVGHSFGSPHDPTECVPDSTDGNYIMYQRSTPGTQTNNDDFSTCSLSSIRAILKSLTDNSNTKFCFQGKELIVILLKFF